ncbi:hypothetical protein UPYG_G00069260 [Umbra pygmaea]|uniref:Uncharacterized protein n=1 Tax=Umbra pygmaea TaxID=75934 RepID=A0ABD0XB69_UMBPY
MTVHTQKATPVCISSTKPCWVSSLCVSWTPISLTVVILSSAWILPNFPRSFTVLGRTAFSYSASVME